jgi:hypothetical protein
VAHRGTSRALLIIWLVACAPSTPGPSLDSDGSRTAAGYIEDEFDRLGVIVTRVPVGTVALPAIRVLGRLYREAHSVSTTDPNLVVRFGPSGDAVLIMAHYDTVAKSPGAADNAVAVALLIELARALRDQPPSQPVVLAFTANEEIGLVGAEALAAARNDIAFAIALDLLGGDGPLVINGASKLVGRSELGWLAAAADQAGITLTTPPAHRVVSRWWPQSERSDHGPFTRRGVRAVHFYNRGNDGDWIDLAYHSPRDVPARVHRDSVAAVGRLLRAVVASPPPVPDGDGFRVPLAANTVVPRWALIAVELALLLVVIITLARSRDGIVAWLARRDQRPTTPRGPALLVGAACYALAIIAACVIERAFSGGHPAPWLHAPLRSLIGDALVLVGSFGLATRAVARIRPWRGGQRYRVLASIVCAVIGTTLLVVGAAELAWIWLVPAAILAVVPPRAALVAIALSLLPVACVLNAHQLREAAWNGFLPLSLPLAAWLGILGTPTIAAVAWWLRRRAPTGPLGTLVLGVGCGLAVIIGLVFAITFEPACSAVKFESFHLACERV